MLVTSPHPPSPGCKIQEIGKFATKHFRFCRGYNFRISNQRDEKLKIEIENLSNQLDEKNNQLNELKSIQKENYRQK